MFKVFDWDYAYGNNSHSSIVLDYIKSVYQTAISEEEFVKGYTALPKSTSKSIRTPSRAKDQYRKLKEVFGFFGATK